MPAASSQMRLALQVGLPNMKPLNKSWKVTVEGQGRREGRGVRGSDGWVVGVACGASVAEQRCHRGLREERVIWAKRSAALHVGVEGL